MDSSTLADLLDLNQTSLEKFPKGTLLKPTILPNGIEISIHECHKAIKRELKLVLPGIDIDSSFLIIPTCQKAKMDLVNVGPDVALEKDLLLEKVCFKVFTYCKT